MEEQVRERERLNAELMASLVHALTEPDPDGGGAVVPTSFTDDSPTYTTPEAGNGHAGTTPETRSEEHTSELQSLMRISYAVFCLKKKNNNSMRNKETTTTHYKTYK